MNKFDKVQFFPGVTVITTTKRNIHQKGDTMKTGSNDIMSVPFLDSTKVWF